MKSTFILGDCLEELKKIEDNYFDLAIADPPYWKVVNEKWDYQWRTEEDYINWCNDWFIETYRTLRFGGTFYLFGYFRMLSLLLPYLLKIGFSLRQQIIINKGIKSVAGRATKNYRLFPNVTESIIFLTKNNIPFSRGLLKARQNSLNLTSKKINEMLGVKSNGGGMWSIYTGKNICEQFPTKEIWTKLEDILEFKYPYEKIAQTYNPELGLTDVWDDIDFYIEKRIHPTQKPLKLIERLIKVSSNPGDKILDPFSGSGSTFLAAENLNRIATAIEIDPVYINKSIERINNYNFSLL
ncbi:site-specific DNA-methyltransferase [Haemophilus parahaemolyticus]|uniref:DNA-methyltransferase n=1 Tax=Haemophilus parahaemolyticus TaxID=735 RepID=UPI0026F1EDE5|nr:site-specific DNA-methyltransferase [Haemophilus parahaemolyticus]MBS6008857.1 site-specific DNA-methyltransferase [Haemophilus parahaemolyticus]